MTTPRGEDLKDLCRELGQKTFEFEFNDKRWTVHYRAANWQTRYNAVENAWKLVPVMGDQGATSEAQFDTAHYYETMLLHCILDINGQQVTLPLLREFSSEVITNLLSIVPAPNIMADLMHSKKEPESSS